MRSSLLQQPHSTEATVTGEATLATVTGEDTLATVTGEDTLATVTGEDTLAGEATTTGGNKWDAQLVHNIVQTTADATIEDTLRQQQWTTAYVLIPTVPLEPAVHYRRDAAI